MSASRALRLTARGAPLRHSSSQLLLARLPRRSRQPRQHTHSSSLPCCRSYSSVRRPEKGWLAGETASQTPIPKAIAAYLDEYVIGQDTAKRALAVGVFNHYIRAASNRSATTVPPSATKAKVKKTGVEGGGAEEEAVLSDFVGQTKGSQRWSEGGKAAAARETEDVGPSALSPTYFSSQRPADSTSRVQPEARQRADRSGKGLELRATLSQLDKSNIIMIGPSGSGKTHLVRTLSTSLSVPFVHVDATPLTSAGYVGEDVESIMARLLEAADGSVEEAERGIVCIDEIDKLASPRPGSSSSIKTTGRDVGGTGVQQALLRLLEGTVVSIADKRGSGAASSSSHNNSAMMARPAGAGSGAAGAGRSKPWWSPEMQSLNAEHARQPPTAAKANSAAVEALGARRKQGSPSSGSDGSGTVRIDTSKILFVLCGAFVGLEDIVAARGGVGLPDVEAEDLTSYGLIPEFVGRLPVLVTLHDLTAKDLERILTEPRNALVSQYQSLFAAYNIKLHFTTSAVASIALQAAQSSTTSSGARMLRRLMEKRLLDAMYDGPGGGARYALMDQSAAQGDSQVQLFSRGGRSAWLNAIEEEEDRQKKKGSGAKGKSEAGTHPFPRSSSTSGAVPATTSLSTQLQHHIVKPNQPSSLLARVDEATLRRRARARLTRPSRVGNLRILTTEG